jgi:hypothetical protein
MRPIWILAQMIPLLMVGAQAEARARAKGWARIGPKAGHCAYIGRKTDLRAAPRRKAKTKGSLPVNTMVKLLALRGGWARVGKVTDSCFAKRTLDAAGWITLKSLQPFFLIATEKRGDVPAVGRKPLYKFDKDEMVLRAFGRRSPTLDDSGGQGYRVWSTGHRRYPFTFHTLAWDMGPGSLTLFGPRKKMLSLTSPGARFSMTISRGAFRVRTDHLCLSLDLRVPLSSLVKKRGWPERMTIERIGLYRPKGKVEMLDLVALSLKTKARAPSKAKAQPVVWPIFVNKLQVRDARKRKRSVTVTVAKDTAFRPTAIVIRKSGGDTEAFLEVELVKSKKRVLLDGQQVGKTSLHVACAG